MPVQKTAAIKDGLREDHVVWTSTLVISLPIPPTLAICPSYSHTLPQVSLLTWLLRKGLFQEHVLGRVDTGDESP